MSPRAAAAGAQALPVEGDGDDRFRPVHSPLPRRPRARAAAGAAAACRPAARRPSRGPPPGEPSTYPRTYPHDRRPRRAPGAPEIRLSRRASSAPRTCRSRASPPRWARRSTAIPAPPSSGTTAASPPPSPTGRRRICYALKANSNLAVIRPAGAARRRRRRRLRRRAPPRAGGRHRRPSGSSSPASARARPRSPSRSRRACIRSTSNPSPSWPPSARWRARWARRAPIAIRVNPDVDAHTHAKIATGQEGEQVRHRPRPRAGRLPPRGAAARHRSRRGRASISARSSPISRPFELAFRRVVELVRALAPRGHRARAGSISAAASASPIATSARRRSRITRRW